MSGEPCADLGEDVGMRQVRGERAISPSPMTAAIAARAVVKVALRSLLRIGDAS
jgi:hypothetical protein